MLCCLSSSFRVVLDFSGTRFKWIESHVTGRLLGVRFVQRYEVGYLRAFVLVLEFNRNFSPLLFILLINDTDNAFTYNRFLLYTGWLIVLWNYRVYLRRGWTAIRFTWTWKSANCLQLNTTKCHVIRFLKSKHQLTNTDFCSLKTIGDFGVCRTIAHFPLMIIILYVVATTNKAVNFIFRFSKQLKILHCSRVLRFSFELFLLRYVINNFNFLSQNSELIIQLRTF